MDQWLVNPNRWSTEGKKFLTSLESGWLNQGEIALLRLWAAEGSVRRRNEDEWWCQWRRISRSMRIGIAICHWNLANWISIWSEKTWIMSSSRLSSSPLLSVTKSSGYDATPISLEICRFRHLIIKNFLSSHHSTTFLGPRTRRKQKTFSCTCSRRGRTAPETKQISSLFSENKKKHKLNRERFVRSSRAEGKVKTNRRQFER